MTEDELNEIETRVNKTTKGPWKSYIEGRDYLSGSNFIMTGVSDGENIWSDSRGNDIELKGATDDDQDFIANARQDIPGLVQEIRRLNQEMKK